MSSIEARLSIIEDRMAIQDVLNGFCNAVDSLSDMDGLLKCFTPDAIFDLSGIHLPKFETHTAIRGFFTEVFKGMTHHAHLSANFTVDALGENSASARAAVLGTGVASDGNSVLVYVRYFLDFVRTSSGWKIKQLREAALMPLPASLTEIHAR
jgi:ketosteroid isomerase-like protein